MNTETIVIRPTGSPWSLRELWRYRYLLFNFAVRDLKVLYKQTLLGVAWSVVRPALTVGVFTLVFGKLARLPGDGIPYSVMVVAGVLPWQFFAGALQESTGSLVANGAMVSKIYFPRVLLPVSATATALADLGIGLLFLLGVLAWHSLTPAPTLLALPLVLLPAWMAALGLGLFFSALNVSYRDFRYVVPFLIQVGLYLSPVGFSASIVPEGWRGLYSLNPMVGVIQMTRWCVAGVGPAPWQDFLAATWVGLGLLVGGVVFFRRFERRFADVI